MMEKCFVLLFILLAVHEAPGDIRTEYVEGLCRRATGQHQQIRITLNVSEESAVRLKPRPSSPYSMDQQCFINVVAKDPAKVLISFKKLDFNVHPSFCESFLRMEFGRNQKRCAYDKSTQGPLVDGNNASSLIMYYKTGGEDDRDDHIGFDVVLTAYKYAPCNDDFNFACNDSSTCISDKLVCNGHTNCPDDSDEFDCSAGEGRFFSLIVTTTWILAIALMNLKY